MSTYTISVTVGSGSIQVQPETQTMTSADEVQWAAQNGQRFSIEFEGNGPFGNSRLAYASATARQKPRVLGRFKYTVVSESNPGVRLDPIIIIDPPPTPP